MNRTSRTLVSRGIALAGAVTVAAVLAWPDSPRGRSTQRAHLLTGTDLDL